MSEDLQPDAIRTRSFSTARRGFERAEVEAFQVEVAQQVEDLQARLVAIDDRLGQLGITELPDLKAEFDTVGEDVRDILQAARDAAEDMRDRAKADAAAKMATAQEESESLRADAWESSQQMVEGVTAEVAGLSAQANEDALFARAEAEREALRLTGNAKRDVEELMSSTQVSAEQTLADAKQQAEEVTDTAQRSVELAEERVRALEERRQELMEELEAARKTLSAVEDKIEGRTEELTHATTDPAETSVRVLTNNVDDAPDISQWLDDDSTVRLVPQQPEMVLGPVDADELVAEVESLRSVPPPVETDDARPELELLSGGSGSSAESASLDFEITGGDVIVAADAAATAELATVEDEPELEPEPDPEPEPGSDAVVAGPEPEPSSAEPEAAATDDIEDLFASLRSPRPPESVDEHPAAETSPATGSPIEPAAVPVVAGAPELEAAPGTIPEPDPGVGAQEVSDGGLDPLELRDRRLFPITNEVLRGIKREIVDVQNAVLEELRTESTEWRPKKAMFGAVLGKDTAALARRSFAEGAAAAGELSGRDSPGITDQSTHDLSSFVTDLWEAVVDAIDVSAGGGNRERAASVGRVFRAWRTDEAERRVRSLAHLEYNAGVAAGLSSLGLGHAVVPPGRDKSDPDATVLPVI